MNGWTKYLRKFSKNLNGLFLKTLRDNEKNHSVIKNPNLTSFRFSVFNIQWFPSEEETKLSSTKREKVRNEKSLSKLTKTDWKSSFASFFNKEVTAH